MRCGRLLSPCSPALFLLLVLLLPAQLPAQQLSPTGEESRPRRSRSDDQLAALQQCLATATPLLLQLIDDPASANRTDCNQLEDLGACLYQASSASASGSNAIFAQLLQAMGNSLLSFGLRQVGLCTQSSVWEFFFPDQSLGRLGVPLIPYSDPVDGALPSTFVTASGPPAHYRLLLASGYFNMCVRARPAIQSRE